MKKVLLSVFLLCECSFLFAQTINIKDVVLTRGQTSSGLSVYTSGNFGYGYTAERLGTCAILNTVSGGNAKITGVARGQGIFYSWQGQSSPSFKIYNIKVVDVVSIDIPGNVKIAAGDNYTYTPIVTDMEAETTLTWASSNTSVATVSSSGVVTASAPGQTTITCTASNGVKAQSVVTVSPLLLSDVVLDTQSHEMSVGDNLQLTASYAPANATTKAVKWLSSNENIAQVDDNGNVTAIGAGYCSIYVKADDGSGKFDKCLIHVNGAATARGDINGDGTVNLSDAKMVVDIFVGNE